MAQTLEQIQQLIEHHLQVIYADVPLQRDIADIASELIVLMGLDDDTKRFQPQQYQNNWDQQDVILITYGNSIEAAGEKPLKTLQRFMDQYCYPVINNVHILPFFPYSSDDGFSVIDYSSVNDSLGSWDDIHHLTERYKVMADLVINHCSSRSAWFDNFIKGEGPGSDFFYTSRPEDDLSAVVRPRTTPLLRETDTSKGVQHVWCTFSHDQVDFDFRNPAVLAAFVSIIRQYLDVGIRLFRLDAVAFLWKQPGTPCINLPQTHEVVRLLRVLLEHACPEGVIITETNIPNRENLAYFGNANEAHGIYNFSLPPLLVNTLISGNCRHLKGWMMSMPPAQHGTMYFNFIASHDGIGLRPAEGLLEDEELSTLLSTMQNFGGRISWRVSDNGQQKPYEINIALFDALQGTEKGPDKWGLNRFICAHAIMFGMEGVPGLYIHSLLATGNDYERLKNTNHNRSINRHRWDYQQLTEALEQPHSQHHKAYHQLIALLKIRIRQPAFHPNATQFTLQLGDSIFGYWRQSHDRRQSIFCISNISDQEQLLSLSDINLIGTDNWVDLISQTLIQTDMQEYTIQPYQTLWITNIPQ